MNNPKLKIIEKDFSLLIGHSTLIYGDIDTGKTHITAQFIKFLLTVKNVRPKDITILDFAPELNYFNNKKIGGRIMDFYEDSRKCNYFTPLEAIIPPRLRAINREDIEKYAQQNYRLTDPLIKKFKENPTDFIIINDLSIFLHKGDFELILSLKDSTNTFFANSYHGFSIKNPYYQQFDDYERDLIEKLQNKVNFSYATD